MCRARAAGGAEERTIGLDIQRCVLDDPKGRAPSGVELLAYDAGGHDEYQEMLKPFVTEATLNVLLCPVAEEITATLREQIVRWALTIQGSAPGSTLILLGSRMDEAADGVEGVQRRCTAVAQCIQRALAKHQLLQTITKSIHPPSASHSRLRYPVSCLSLIHI